MCEFIPSPEEPPDNSAIREGVVGAVLAVVAVTAVVGLTIYCFMGDGRESPIDL